MGTRDIVGEALGRTALDPGLTPELHFLLAESVLLVPVSRLPADSTGHERTAVALWREPSSGTLFVPLFTAMERIPKGCPPTIALVWDSLKRLVRVMPQADFRINPSGPVTYDLPQALAQGIVDPEGQRGKAHATISAGTDLGIGPTREDHGTLAAALYSHFSRQQSAPTVYLYELFRPVGAEISHSLAIGVISDYEPKMAAAIAAIVPESYNGTLPVDIGFLAGNPEVVEAIARAGIEPVVQARALGRHQKN